MSDRGHGRNGRGKLFRGDHRGRYRSHDTAPAWKHRPESALAGDTFADLEYDAERLAQTRARARYPSPGKITRTMQLSVRAARAGQLAEQRTHRTPRIFRKAESGPPTSLTDDNRPANADDLEAIIWCGSLGGAETDLDVSERELPETGPGDVLHAALNDSSSTPLPPDLQASLGSLLGADLSDVRVHTDARSARAAEAIGAKAFTAGRHIHFSNGAYDPSSVEGRRLIAHEAVHTVQAEQAPSSSAETPISDPHEPAEQVAEELAEAFVRQEQTAQPSRATKPIHVGLAKAKILRFPGVVTEVFEEDKKRYIDPGDKNKGKVWTEQRGYIKNPTATRLDDIVKDGKIKGRFANGKAMYVIDQNGTVWLGHRQGLNMPHPTLIGGKAPQIQAAGMIDTHKGKIIRIDNHSGHFRPPRSALKASMKAFLKFPGKLFNGLKVESIHFKNGAERWKRFRSLRMLKLKKLELGKALGRVRGRYKHDPKFRGRLRGGAKAGLGIVVALVVSYFFGKWMAELEEERIKKDLEKLQPKVEGALKRSLERQADTLDALFEKNPKSKIYMNITYRIGYFKYIDPEDGAEKDYHTSEFVAAEFSTSPIDTGMKYSSTDNQGCGMTSMEWHRLSMSEELELADLYEAFQ